jgi:hypothetical protein
MSVSRQSPFLVYTIDENGLEPTQVNPCWGFLIRLSASFPNSKAEAWEEVMRKLFLTTAVLLLSSSWVLAQSNSSQSAQQPDKSQTAAADKGAQTIEGCLSGAADTFKLTDASGKTYELTGDTSGLAENVGHKVRLWGSAGSTGGGEKISASGPQATFGVKKVQSLSDTCK